MEQRIERFKGTAVGTEDVDLIRWLNSEWRILKVKWDAASEPFVHQERVSPWNIEPIEPIQEKNMLLFCTYKRRHAWKTNHLLGFLSQSRKDYCIVQMSIQMKASWRSCKVKKLGTQVLINLVPFKPPPVSHLTSPLNPDWNYSQIGQDNQLQFWIRGPIYPCPSNTVSFPGGNIARLEACQFQMSLAIGGSQKWRGLELKHANEVPLASPHRYMLFGVNLVSNSPELPSPQVATSAVHESHNYVPATSQSSVSEPSKSTSGVNSGKTMQELLLYCYSELHKGPQIWNLYSDDEGDMMQFNDCPWQEFQSTVRRIFISPKEEIGNLNPQSPNPSPSG
ncbi:hypothetical protein OIU78_015228 [Salix suchowensis]|nr:hypothetical protein OIU78_015228 [Salix suchowensis]